MGWNVALLTWADEVVKVETKVWSLRFGDDVVDIQVLRASTVWIGTSEAVPS